MKKFLSLVLALIMTMSLVTIGASAAEYKDFTDKDEITYAEAVAVLNRLGIITGYSEGDFRPEGELTRGAAAKIIASLLIGPEAANNLTPTTAPFKDVPLDHTFAGPIAYCSTLKIINGYSDGSFQPGGTLTGYAFSKMLLGALGYDGNVEGFVGSGWNMNVMRLGGDAGLFDSISFKGNEPVNREQAAQLALNTLKATLVEYTGGLNVTAGDASVTSKPTRTYVISNQEFATHISNRKASEVGNANVTTHYTVEFGEQHFVDLRMTYDRNTYDDFGRPSNEWSYKKVTIGTFPIEPDYVYTEQMEHNVSTVTNATKARALGLTGFEIKSDSGRATTVTVNGKVETKKLTDVGEIADYTDNGTVVEVYISDDDADWVRDVVVVKTQLMEVKRIGKDYVALDLYDDGSSNKSAVIGFNQAPINAKTENVEIDDAYYTLLSGLKVNDRVAVVPVTTDDGANYTVAKAYVPETASGKLNKVDTYGNGKDVGSGYNTVGVTVGDTAYDVALWNKDLSDIDSNKLDVTTKDVTLTLDEFGNALLAEDVGATSDFMIVGSYYQNLVNGKLMTYVKGWDISGEELNLNLGSKSGVKEENSNIKPGDLVYYTNSTKGDADWELNDTTTKGVFDVSNGIDSMTNTNYAIKASNTRILLSQDYVTGDNRPWIDKSVKFIYVTYDENGDVDFIEIKNGVQAATYEELIRCSNHDVHPGNTACAYNAAQVALKLNKGAVTSDSTVKAVVIKNESNDAVATNMLYVVNYEGSVQKRSDDGELVYEYTVAMNGPDGIIDDDMTIYSTKKLNRGDWARYTEVKDDNFENFYTLKAVDQRGRATSTMVANFSGTTYPTANKALLYVDSTKLYAIDDTKLSGSTGIYALPNIKSNTINNLGVGDNIAYLISLRYARWVDLTGNQIDSFDDLYDLTQKDKKFALNSVKVSMIFNDDETKDNFRQVAMIVVQSVGDSSSSSGVGTANIDVKEVWQSGGSIFVDLTADAPAYVVPGSTATVRVDFFADDVKVDTLNLTVTDGLTRRFNTSNLGLRGTENVRVVVNPSNDTLAWSDVYAHYYDADGNDITSTMVGAGSPSSVSMTSANFHPVYPSTISGGTISVVAKADDPAVSYKNHVTLGTAVSGWSYASNKYTASTGAAQADGLGYADFVVTATGLIEKFSVDLASATIPTFASLPDTGSTLTLTMTPDADSAASGATQPKGSPIVITANIDTISNAAGYTVSLKVNNVPYSVDILAAKAGAEVKVAGFDLNGNYDVTDVNVVAIPKIAVVEGAGAEVTVTNPATRTYLIPFNKKIEAVSGQFDSIIDTATSTAPVLDWSITDDGLLVRLSDDLTTTAGATATIVINASKLQGKGDTADTLANKTLTWTVNTSKWTIA